LFLFPVGKETRGHQHFRFRLYSLQIAHLLQAAHARQVIIENHQVQGPALVKHLQNFLPIGSRLHRIAQFLQKLLPQGPDMAVVIHQKNLHRRRFHKTIMFQSLINPSEIQRARGLTGPGLQFSGPRPTTEFSL